MYFVKLRHAQYDAGKVFTFSIPASATSFIENALIHGQPDKDGNPLVAEIWEENDTNRDTRKPDD